MAKYPAGTLRLRNSQTGNIYTLIPNPPEPRFIPPSKTNGMQLVQRPTTSKGLAAANVAKVNIAKKIA